MTVTAPLPRAVRLLCTITFSPDFEPHNRLVAGRELVQLGYDLDVVRRRYEREMKREAKAKRPG